MNYTPDELAQFQNILTAFQDYLTNSPCFDILFSSKEGYLFLQIEKDFLEVYQIDTPDKLFERFVFEISSDVRDLFLCGEHTTIDLYLPEIIESHKRILPYIARLPEDLQAYYTAWMENYFPSSSKE